MGGGEGGGEAVTRENGIAELIISLILARNSINEISNTFR